MTATATATEIKERPIIFSGPMVKAILEGRKTQTRRVITNERIKVFAPGYADDCERILGLCPYGRIGDRLWVRETWQPIRRHSPEQDAKIKASLDRLERGEVKDIVAEVNGWPFPPNGKREVLYAADFGEWAYDVDSDLKPWKSPLFLPRDLSRITLEITNVRVERLQEISERDAEAEGVTRAPFSPNRIWIANPANSRRHIKTFRKGWDELNARRGYSWASNPWVWCISFRRI